MQKNKGGLHKDIASIFDGVHLPGQENTQDCPSSAPEPQPQHSIYAPECAEHRNAYSSGSKNAQTSAPVKQQPKSKPASPEAILRPASLGAQKSSQPSVLSQWFKQLKIKMVTLSGADSKQKKMIALIPVLTVILLVVLFKAIGSGPSGQVATSPVKPSAAIAQQSKPAEIQWKIPQTYEDIQRDPMKMEKKPIAAVNETGDILVKGIVFSNDNPTAVIGTEIYHEGSEIAGATIIKINPDSVEFEKDGRRWEEPVRP